jgi:peptide/nickel transport system permease protein
VLTLILQKLPVTIQLSAFSMVIALGIGIPAGVIAAVRKGTAVDHTATVIALSGLSLPNFWLGLMMILVVSVQFNLLPSSGFVSVFDNPVEAFRTSLMPAIVLGTGIAAYIMRHTRSAMLEVMSSDYVRTARAKGLLEDKVIWKHAFRNALIPVVTTSTLLFGELMGGAVLTEQIFGIPGFGKLVVDGVFNRDYAVVQGIVLCVAIAFIAMNLLADVLYILVNPRLRRPS